jgi:nicotinamide phosphoribosyltransferase
MEVRPSIITSTDSYKFSHHEVIRDDVTKVASYGSSRGGRLGFTIVEGIQPTVKKYLMKPITVEDIDFAEEMATLHGEPFHRKMWEGVIKDHNGYLPVKIRAVKEGTKVPNGNAFYTIETNSAVNPKLYRELAQYLETVMLRGVWYPTAVATQSFGIFEDVAKAMAKSSDRTIEDVLFMVHDFGARGVSSGETAGIGGCTHTTVFRGTDTFESLLHARQFYNAKISGFSVRATEHSISTMYGKEGEEDYFRQMIKKWAKPGKIFAVVSDTYNIHKAVKFLASEEIVKLVKESGARLVVRPDSGDPQRIIPEILEILAEGYGFTTNSKGYRVLPDCIRVIQGDGMNYSSIRSLYETIIVFGWSAENLAVGSGGALLQSLSRDDNKVAQKASYIELDSGESLGIYKDPVTDAGKRSMAGLLTLVMNTKTGEFKTVDRHLPIEDDWVDMMDDVYDNGVLLRDEQYEDIQKRVMSYFM